MGGTGEYWSHLEEPLQTVGWALSCLPPPPTVGPPGGRQKGVVGRVGQTGSVWWATERHTEVSSPLTIMCKAVTFNQKLKTKTTT